MRRPLRARSLFAIFSVLALACGPDLEAPPAPHCTKTTGCPAGSVCVDGARCVPQSDAAVAPDDAGLAVPGLARVRLEGPGRGPAGQRDAGTRLDAGARDDGGAQQDGGAPVARIDAGNLVCLAGQTFCTGRCVDVRADPSNCGACGIVCQGADVCDFGVCCGAGFTSCDGLCVDLFADPRNCGVCGLECPGPARCVLGGCQPL